MNAAAWFYSQPGLHAAPTPAQPRSIQIGDTAVTEYWDGHDWRERRMVWDGAKYTEVTK